MPTSVQTEISLGRYMVPRQQRMPAMAKRDIMLAGLNFFISAVVMARQAMNRTMEKM